MTSKNTSFFHFLLGGILLFTSCEKFNNVNPNMECSDEELYLDAIKDAMITDPDEICTDLIPIDENNSYLNWKDTGSDKQVLVVTWTNHPERYSENSTLTNNWGEIWVTVVPEMKDWFETNYPSGDDYVLRTEKLLGLPKNDGKTHFVEIWVSPEDLWRPSPDYEITDQTAQLEFPINTDSTYQAWFNSTILFSYYPMRYPWTRLGYTYDWDSTTSEIGLSEFVIKPNSQCLVHQIQTNDVFFSQVGSGE